ncbi:uncharacterized protein [Henckelia pumila]|uniref:uncharacterized protein isoform X2 n=1 Tax=Henckelia pumila TaxID=405737 RepID=UPI003C6E5473
MMKVVGFELPGGPDVLQVKELPTPILGINEIMIEVEAAGLNVFDTWFRQDIPFYRYTFNAYLGYECAGTVVAVSSNIHEFKVGDEVCAILLRGGAYAEFVVVPPSEVRRIPSRVSLVQAATLPEASRLTIFALSVLPNVTPGKTFLIHGTAGGFDIIAIQYFKHIGCKVFVVAGVDVILDDSERDHFKKNVDCLARSGSLVVLGHKIGSWVNVDLSILMKKDIKIKGVDLQYLGYGEMMRLWSDVEAKIWPLIEEGHIEPVIGRAFTFNEAAEAHRALEENNVPGKLLLVP